MDQKEHCVIGRVFKLVQRPFRNKNERCVDYVYFPFETIEGDVVPFRVRQDFFHLLRFDLMPKGEGYETPFVKIVNLDKVFHDKDGDFRGYMNMDSDFTYDFTDATVVRKLTKEEVDRLPEIFEASPRVTVTYLGVKSTWSRDVLISGTECRVHLLDIGILKEYRDIGETSPLYLEDCGEYELHCVKEIYDRGTPKRTFHFALYSYVKRLR